VKIVVITVSLQRCNVLPDLSYVWQHIQNHESIIVFINLFSSFQQ